MPGRYNTLRSVFNFTRFGHIDEFAQANNIAPERNSHQLAAQMPQRAQQLTPLSYNNTTSSLSPSQHVAPRSTPPSRPMLSTFTTAPQASIMIRFNTIQDCVRKHNENLDTAIRSAEHIQQRGENLLSIQHHLSNELTLQAVRIQEYFIEQQPLSTKLNQLTSESKVANKTLQAHIENTHQLMQMLQQQQTLRGPGSSRNEQFQELQQSVQLSQTHAQNIFCQLSNLTSQVQTSEQTAVHTFNDLQETVSHDWVESEHEKIRHLDQAYQLLTAKPANEFAAHGFKPNQTQCFISSDKLDPSNPQQKVVALASGTTPEGKKSYTFYDFENLQLWINTQGKHPVTKQNLNGSNFQNHLYKLTF